jgi:hypothetical protein
MMEAQNQAFDWQVPAAGLELNEPLHGLGLGCFPGIVLVEHERESFVRQQLRFLWWQDGQLWIQIEFVKVLADEPETEAVQRADVSGIQQSDLLGEMRGARFLRKLLFKRVAKALAHLGGGCIREGDDEQVLDGVFGPGLQQPSDATFYQRASLSSSSARDNQDVASRLDSLLLVWGETRH